MQQNNAVRYQYPKNGIWGHIAKVALLKAAGQRSAICRDWGGLGTPRYRSQQGTMSTQEDAQASAARSPREIIDSTQDCCSGPAAPGIEGSFSSPGSSRCSGSSGTPGVGGSSRGLMPASTSTLAPPAAPLAVRKGTLRNWTVGKGSAQALDEFCEANFPKPSQQARSLVGASRSSTYP